MAKLVTAPKTALDMTQKPGLSECLWL